MGFLKKIIILLSLLMISGCSKSIVLDQVSQYEDNILSYGILPGNNFFVDEIKPDQLQLEWDASAHGSFASTSFITNDTLVFVSDLGGRVTSFSLNDGKEIGQLKYSGGIEQTLAVILCKLVSTSSSKLAM